jgi:protein tyrosine phosphatase (PTP) superfamily phosphohydrolase (DUF442 family)
MTFHSLHNVEIVEKGVLTGGSQPRGPAWDLIASKGFRTVVNLRKEDHSEEPKVRSLGMRPVHIPIVDGQPPTFEQVRRFIEVVGDSANHPVFVHCHGGVGRTHTMIAAWRISQGVPLSQALSEGQQWGLRELPQLVFLKRFSDWWRRRQGPSGP